MPWIALHRRLRVHVSHASSTRRAHRALTRELADYVTPAERDDLMALIVGRGAADCAAAEILARQAYGDLFRCGAGPLPPRTGAG
ncbi:hypothetical protein ACI782_12525 [Geodermatophilus sp. SYSU D00703]